MIMHGHLTTLITDVKKRNRLGNDVKITEDSICKRHKRGRIFLGVDECKIGPKSPLCTCEQEIIQILV